MQRAGTKAIGTLAAVLLAGACGSSGQPTGAKGTVAPLSGSPGAPVTTAPHPPTTLGLPQSPTTAPGAAAPKPATAAPPSTVVDIAGSGSYVLSVTLLQGSAPCATPGLGGAQRPFRVSISNRGGADEPLARVAVAIDDPAGASARAVAAFSYSGLCLNFTEPGGTLAAGQTVSYDGTASGVSPTAVLVANVIAVGDSATLGTVTTPLRP